MIRYLATFFLLCFAVTSAKAEDDFIREGKDEIREAKDALENKVAPALEVENWINAEADTTLESFKGKVVVIDFWGVWCPPCRAAIPHLIELYEEHKDDGLVVIGVHTSRDAEKMAEFVADKEIPYPVASDVEGATVAKLKVDGYPDYYLIDRSGKIRFADLANKEVDRAVEMLLAEEASGEEQPTEK